MLESFFRYRPRPRIMNWLRPARQIDPNYAPYTILSGNPPIFFMPYWIDDQLLPLSSLDMLFEYLRDRRAYFLFNWFWQIEEPRKIAAYHRLEQAHQREYPGHRFIHLCNTTRQIQRFRDAGLEAIFCNQNCLVDESIFRPLPEVAKEFDAIYDGRLIDHKRHHLANKVASLGLVYAFNQMVDSRATVDRIRKSLAHAYFFNHPEGGEYRVLPSAEVNRSLNRCRVGLCLSAVEGAMYASIQYLLAGLPVVSTHSEGGRDVMFDENFVTITEAAPEAVAAAVASWCREAPEPEFIRARTLEKVRAHRRRFIDLVQTIYDEEGVIKIFEEEWSGIFFNKLYRSKTSHQETIEFLKNL